MSDCRSSRTARSRRRRAAPSRRSARPPGRARVSGHHGVDSSSVSPTITELLELGHPASLTESLTISIARSGSSRWRAGPRRPGPRRPHRRCGGGQSEVVDVEQIGSERVAAAVALAPLGIDVDPHPTTTGIVRGPRTWPPAHVTVGGWSSENVGIAFKPLLDRDPQLHPRQVRSGAAMDADAERDVAVVHPVDDHLVGVGELPPGHGWPRGSSAGRGRPPSSGSPPTSMSSATIRAIVTGE